MIEERAQTAPPLSPEHQVVIARLREDLAERHAELRRSGAVSASGGSLSSRIPGADLLLITPDAGDGDAGPERMVLCDLDGRPVADTPGADLATPSDVAVHGELYRQDPTVGGIARSRAAHVAAWAAAGEAVPCVTVAMAEEFGGDLPLAPAPAAAPGPEAADVARTLLTTVAASGSPALLVPHDGVVAVGADARAAARSVLIAEQAATTAHLARQLGTPARLAPDDIRSHAARRRDLRASSAEAMP